MPLDQLIKNLPSEKYLKTLSRPYSNHSVEFKKSFTVAERTNVLEKDSHYAAFSRENGIRRGRDNV